MTRKRRKNKGWPNEPIRHSLASKGIETTAKSTTKENDELIGFHINRMIDEMGSLDVPKLFKDENMEEVDEYMWNSKRFKDVFQTPYDHSEAGIRGYYDGKSGYYVVLLKDSGKGFIVDNQKSLGWTLSVELDKPVVINSEDGETKVFSSSGDIFKSDGTKVEKGSLDCIDDIDNEGYVLDFYRKKLEYKNNLKEVIK